MVKVCQRLALALDNHLRQGFFIVWPGEKASGRSANHRQGVGIAPTDLCQPVLPGQGRSSLRIGSLGNGTDNFNGMQTLVGQELVRLYRETPVGVIRMHIDQRRLVFPGHGN